ncbi:hypothetical protein BDW74DRAFT_176024 [Aspergillus multicolor]|uniref:nucleic acid/nucleotide deaminase domain-containing protein n=1 Tax=Aspergillus multicolor TaxID=41759 RepID=UPI003CCCD19F
MSHVQVLLRPVEKPLNEAGYPYSIWRFPPDIESEITTLATICQIKHQQCTPLAAGREEDIHEIDSSDDEGDENGSNFATDVAGRLRTATQKSTRMNFLDRMAELLCRKKEAHYVTCTSLMEREEEATILAARNASWDGLDIKLLEKIAKMLEAVASHDSSTEDAFDLRKEFSDYYSPRLNHHAKALLNLLGKSKGLEDFTSYINGFLNRRIPASAFVETVDNLGHSTDFYSQLKDNVLPSKMYRQCRELESICRPNHSFATFYQAAREIAGLKRVKIVLLPGYPPRQVQPQLSLCSEHYRARHPERLDVALKKDKWVHAEIRMILHLFSTDSVGRMFPYLGISKKTCLLCGHVLSHMGIFQARNNHGKVYGQWTLPHAIAMPAAIHGRLDATVQKLREVLHHECNSGDNKHLAPMKESTISTPVAERHDAWSPFNRSIPDLRSQSRENEWLSKRDMEEASGRNLAQTLKPREKLESYVFWLQIRNGFMPDVDEDNWIYLGFCTASNVSQTQRIAQLYGMLIKRAKFEEFWQARVSSSMVALFQKHGLGEEIRKMRNFQTLMSAMGTWYQSVWELKRFTLLSQPFPHRAVAVDYGFRNCQTPVERMNLRDAYTQFFKNEGDEMTLHYACIENQLASFMESELGPLSFDAALLHSPYPLDGCAHMGMIVETAVLCSESAYNEVEKLHRAQGLDGVILTHPDEADAEFDAALEDRAAYLGRRVQIRTTRIGDVTMQLRSGM